MKIISQQQLLDLQHLKTPVDPGRELSWRNPRLKAAKLKESQDTSALHNQSEARAPKDKFKLSAPSLISEPALASTSTPTNNAAVDIVTAASGGKDPQKDRTFAQQSIEQRAETKVSLLPEWQKISVENIKPFDLQQAHKAGEYQLSRAA